MEAALTTEPRPSSYALSFVDGKDGARVALYSWPLPAAPKAVVQIAHGLAEHAARYDRLAQTLVKAGYAVYASDHRGHGKTARNSSELGFFGESRGFEHLVEDLYAVNRHVRALHPALPHVLFGHSFGSFVTQSYLFKHAESVDAVVLSGTTRAKPLVTLGGIAVAHAERVRVGARGTSKLLQRLSFGSYNDAFKPNRTEFDWLSRDPAEVDKYVNDPFCGFDTTVQGWIDLLGGLLYIRSSELQRTLPKQLPIYVMSGAEDPVGGSGRGPARLVQRLQQAGLTRVTLRLYDKARHELLNETNRDQVTTDLLAWLDSVVRERNPG